MRAAANPAEIDRLISVLEKPDDLMNLYRGSLANNPLLARLDSAFAAGRFVDDDGNVEQFDDACITPFQAALIHFLVTTLRPPVTVETGFGLGVSALTFLAAGSEYDHRKHVTIDPYGLPGRGGIILNYINKLPNNRFVLVKEASEYALPRLVSQGELEDCYVSLIDGCHWFEIALADFTYLDVVTPVGGCIVVDDTAAPAVETVINYIRSNKRNYRVVRPRPNTVVLVKLILADGRKWYHFRPFDVPKRNDWTAAGK